MREEEVFTFWIVISGLYSGVTKLITRGDNYANEINSLSLGVNAKLCSNSGYHYGARQSAGLFVSPLNTSTGLGIVSISFALAIGQFVWGLAQPVFGAIADKKGSYGVLVMGAFILAGGLALTPLVNSEWSLVLTMVF